jgi:hypothetical protein
MRPRTGRTEPSALLFIFSGKASAEKHSLGKSYTNHEPKRGQMIPNWLPIFLYYMRYRNSHLLTIFMFWPFYNWTALHSNFAETAISPMREMHLSSLMSVGKDANLDFIPFSSHSKRYQLQHHYFIRRSWVSPVIVHPCLAACTTSFLF